MKEMNAALESAMTEFDNELTKMFLNADNLESWTQRWTLLFSGIPENREEDTNQIALSLYRDMGIKVLPHEIC